MWRGREMIFGWFGLVYLLFVFGPGLKCGVRKRATASLVAWARVQIKSSVCVFRFPLDLEWLHLSVSAQLCVSFAKKTTALYNPQASAKKKKKVYPAPTPTLLALILSAFPSHHSLRSHHPYILENLISIITKTRSDYFLFSSSVEGMWQLITHYLINISSTLSQTAMEFLFVVSFSLHSFPCL